MAVRTPDLDHANSLPPHRLPIPDTSGNAGAANRDGTIALQGGRWRWFYFDGSLDSGDTFDSGIPNPVCAAWMPLTAANVGLCYVSNRSTGEINFVSNAGSRSGWIGVFSRG